MARRLLRLWTEERPPIRRVHVNVLNKQSRTADKGWFSSLGIGRGGNNYSPSKFIFLRNIHRVCHQGQLTLVSCYGVTNSALYHKHLQRPQELQDNRVPERANCYRGLKYLVTTDCEVVYTLIVVSFKTTKGMGGACSAYKAEGKYIRVFWWGKLKIRKIYVSIGG
jgi:hypothetical protein